MIAETDPGRCSTLRLLTRSRASRTAVCAMPTTEKPEVPPGRCASMVTSGASTPLWARLCTRSQAASRRAARIRGWCRRRRDVPPGFPWTLPPVPPRGPPHPAPSRVPCARQPSIECRSRRPAARWQVTRRTPSRYRTRVITDGVIPSLHVDYKHSRIPQTTVINDTYDFDVGRRLKNLEALKAIGFAANRRLLGVQRISHDCSIGRTASKSAYRGRPTRLVATLRRPAGAGSVRCPRGLPAAARGLRQPRLARTVAPLMGCPSRTTTAIAPYDLRRLRLRGLIERIPRTRRYRVTRTACAPPCATTAPTPASSAIAVASTPRRVRPASAVCSTPSITSASGRAANAAT